MSINLRWTTGEQDEERVALTRLRCYERADNTLDAMRACARADRQSGEAEFLLATNDTEDVGTATSLTFDMVCRGAPVKCQGVAWVGTIKTARRRGNEGIATTLMNQTIARAREQGCVVSALMPFRASFYQHFGYGIVERRCEWTIPLSILNAPDSSGFHFANPDETDLIHACRQRRVMNGQCDIVRSPTRWKLFHDNRQTNALTVVDRPDPAGPVRGWMWMQQVQKDGKDILHAEDGSWDSPDALRRQLGFLGTLRDQYASARLTLPVDVPLNHLLKEPQVPHRLVNHAVPEMRTFTRMQMRILDHAQFLQSLNWPTDVKGMATIRVQESEGPVSTFDVTVEAGRAQVKPSNASPDATTSDVTWASVATGNVRASDARQWGLIESNDRATKLLDAMSVGPLPYSNEYF